MYVLFKYVAAFATSARSVAGTLVPLVALEPEAYHQPFGLSKVTLVRFVQSLNAPAPIDVTLSGMVMLERLVQPLNAKSRI